MIPLAVNPTVVVLVDDTGKIKASATNVASDLRVEVVTDEATFKEKALGKPFLKETRHTSLVG